MSKLHHVEPDDIRANFSAAMSDMYRLEVPLYGTLLDLVAAIDGEANVERHGAIRLGTAQELRTMRRVLAVMGMHPVGYYDLAPAGVPVHSTAFRPVTADALRASPFRLFTSLLRLDLIHDDALRSQAQAILARRQVFSRRLLELVERHETHGGLTQPESEDFIAQAVDTFRWHPQAPVSEATYRALHHAHRLIADVVCFKGPHINHLTPRTRDIDAAQAQMLAHGIPAKDAIEGPPARKVPILLRQTSFKALEEKVVFAGGERSEGTHTARFGEIEQRGIALTRKGRALYDRLLAESRDADASRVFAAFPDDIDTLRSEGLAFFRYSVVDGTVVAEPIVYEDFLPVSAAGIFQSNLGSGSNREYSARDARAEFEEALGANVIDEFALYEEQQRQSIEALSLDIAGANA